MSSSIQFAKFAATTASRASAGAKTSPSLDSDSTCSRSSAAIPMQHSFMPSSPLVWCAARHARAAGPCVPTSASSPPWKMQKQPGSAPVSAAVPQRRRGNSSDQIRAHIEKNLDRPVRLAELGRVAGMSPFTVQRLFKQSMGVSPLQYQRALKAGRLRAALKQGEAGHRRHLHCRIRIRQPRL